MVSVFLDYVTFFIALRLRICTEHMGFHYKNFIVVIMVCSAAFGGFFSFVYSAEQVKSEVKNEEEVLVPEKHYDEKDIARIHEAIMVAQRKLLADEKKRIVAAEGDAKKRKVAPRVQAQKKGAGSITVPPLTPLAVPQVNVAVIPSLPVIPPAPIALAPTTTISPVTTPAQTIKPTQPRTTVS